MRFFKGLLSVVAMMISLTALPALAANEGLFTVRDVPVDATANEAAEARVIAIRQGQHTALRLLMQRLTLQMDWPLLPALSTEDVTALGSGIEVSNERNSPTRYLATITYRFKPDEVRRILKDNDIPFSEAQARPAVVLPVFVRGTEVLMWEDDNLWTAAWKGRNYTHDLVSIITPLGDLGDVMSTSREAVAAADYTQLVPYAERYGVQDILLAIVTQENESAPLSLQVFRIGPSGAESFDLLLPLSNDLKGSMNFAIDRIVEKLQEDWKSKTIIRYGDERPMTISAEYGSLGEWMKIRKAIEATPNILDHKLVAQSIQGAEMNWQVVGSPDQLALALSQYSVTLEPGPISGDTAHGYQPPARETNPYSGSSLPASPSPYDSDYGGGYGSPYGSGQSALQPDYWIVRYQQQTVVDETPFTLEDEEDPDNLESKFSD
ncbi:MAG: DUF2066 domain-containing protein [Alphaproteobacteria bacterium]|nr:MAG: DUF2066 domain-containing protein [Alphaproteobacteria bacterium]